MRFRNACAFAMHALSQCMRRPVRLARCSLAAAAEDASMRCRVREQQSAERSLKRLGTRTCAAPSRLLLLVEGLVCTQIDFSN
jgi:hypothetical protein